jgi:hypothetical protein
VRLETANKLPSEREIGHPSSSISIPSAFVSSHSHQWPLSSPLLQTFSRRKFS